MKTIELDLKKKVFIVDLPIDAKNIYMSGDSVIFNTNKSCIIKSLNGNYESLCKGSELTEEIASELVETHKNCRRYIDYTIKERNRFFELSIPSFISAVESKGFYWLEKECDNQFCENGKVDVGYNTFLNCQVCEELEEKTFKNPLIFVKK